MARLNSKATGGYFPTPLEVIQRIGAMIAPAEVVKAAQTAPPEILDPCAGDGAALELLASLLGCTPIGVEAEESRAERLTRRLRVANRALHGNAFHLEAPRHNGELGPAVLFLNPPYDTDPVYGRTEERFLVRFTGMIADTAVLVFVVPVSALMASAHTLVKHYGGLQCWRFPGALFDPFKQVVVMGHRRAIPLDDAESGVGVVAQWVAKGSALPELPAEGELPGYLYAVPAPVWGTTGTRKPSKVHHPHTASWKVHDVDRTIIAGNVRPWVATTRGGSAEVASLYLPRPSEDVFDRRFTVAMPPKPAHLASAVASGLFNGARIAPDLPGTGPEILVKGTFTRSFKTIEEKTNAEGDVYAAVQVQQPRLDVTVLDLSAGTYHLLTPSTDDTGSTDPGTMTTGDLLRRYSVGMQKVLRDHCTVIHDPLDPAQAFPLPEMERDLYTHQTHATRACVKLLGGYGVPFASRRGKAAVLLGEIGSGKTTIAMTAARAAGAQRMLVVAPPHLLASWEEQAKAVWPEARVVFLFTVHDVDAFLADVGASPCIAVMSREAAKLTSYVEAMTGACPGCGAALPTKNIAHQRAFCAAIIREPALSDAGTSDRGTRVASLLSRLYPLLAGVMSSERREALALTAFRTRIASTRVLDPMKDPATLQVLAALIEELSLRTSEGVGAALKLLMAVPSWTWRAQVAARIVEKGRPATLMLLAAAVPPKGAPGHAEGVEALTSAAAAMTGRKDFDRWSVDHARKEAAQLAAGSHVWSPVSITPEPTGRQVGESLENSLDLLWDGLSGARVYARWTSRTCGEALWTFTGSPRRVDLARYFARRAKARKFQYLLCVDEAHEYSGDGSAQGVAATRLMQTGAPTLALTGSLMAGYADTLFQLWWPLFPDFREEFKRSQKALFVDRYGYRKRQVPVDDREVVQVAKGAASDRKVLKEKDLGVAPGVMPAFILKHLLPHAVVIHKADIVDLLPCVEHAVSVPMGSDVGRIHPPLMRKVRDQLKDDRFDPRVAGALWGQLAISPYHADRITTDSETDPGAYVVRYPERCSGAVGDMVVHRAEALAATVITPKEEEMLRLIAEERAQGRKVVVLAWSRELLPRYQRLCKARFGIQWPILDAEKVSAGKRQEWITSKVIATGAEVLFTNPVAISTGLNVLVAFCTALWMQDPMCNPTVFRQTIGRFHRIGQNREVRVFTLRYAQSAQALLYDLLRRKVEVSLSVDGLDADSALQAAGVGENPLSGLSLAKQLLELMEASPSAW